MYLDFISVILQKLLQDVCPIYNFADVLEDTNRFCIANCLKKSYLHQIPLYRKLATLVQQHAIVPTSKENKIILNIFGNKSSLWFHKYVNIVVNNYWKVSKLSRYENYSTFWSNKLKTENPIPEWFTSAFLPIYNIEQENHNIWLKQYSFIGVFYEMVLTVYTIYKKEENKKDEEFGGKEFEEKEFEAEDKKRITHFIKKHHDQILHTSFAQSMDEVMYMLIDETIEKEEEKINIITSYVIPRIFSGIDHNPVELDFLPKFHTQQNAVMLQEYLKAGVVVISNLGLQLSKQLHEDQKDGFRINTRELMHRLKLFLIHQNNNVWVSPTLIQPISDLIVPKTTSNQDNNVLDELENPFHIANAMYEKARGFNIDGEHPIWHFDMANIDLLECLKMAVISEMAIEKQQLQRAAKMFEFGIEHSHIYIYDNKKRFDESDESDESDEIVNNVNTSMNTSINTSTNTTILSSLAKNVGCNIFDSFYMYSIAFFPCIREMFDRYYILEKALKKHGLRIFPCSKVCSHYVIYGTYIGPPIQSDNEDIITKIVDVMLEMSFFLHHTNYRFWMKHFNDSEFSKSKAIESMVKTGVLELVPFSELKKRIPLRFQFYLTSPL